MCNLQNPHMQGHRYNKLYFVLGVKTMKKRYYKHTNKTPVTCSCCNKELRKSDATKVELIFVGKRSRHIVHCVKYFHPIHYNGMMSSLCNDIKEYQTAALQFEAEKFKIFGTHLTRLDRERLALGGLVFHKLLIALNTGLEDALYGEASVKIKIRPAKGYMLYNKWMIKKWNR